MNERTLILGAGELGLPILQELSPNVTVLLPPHPNAASQAKRRALRERGITVVEADLARSSAEELAAVFADYSQVIGCTGFVGGPGTQHKLARAALQSGIEHYIPWQFGVDYDVIGTGSGQDLFDEQLEVRALLREQNRLKWTIISTGMFTSFLFVADFGVVELEQRRVRALGSWDHQLTLTAPEDIGRLTALVARNWREYAGQVVYLAGDTLSYTQLAELLGPSFQRELWSVEYLRDELRKHPEDTMCKYRLAFARPDGVAWPKESSLNVRLQIPMMDVAGWLRAKL